MALEGLVGDIHVTSPDIEHHWCGTEEQEDEGDEDMPTVLLKQGIYSSCLGLHLLSS